MSVCLLICEPPENHGLHLCTAKAWLRAQRRHASSGRSFGKEGRNRDGRCLLIWKLLGLVGDGLKQRSLNQKELVGNRGREGCSEIPLMAFAVTSTSALLDPKALGMSLVIGQPFWPAQSADV